MGQGPHFGEEGGLGSRPGRKHTAPDGAGAPFRGGGRVGVPPGKETLLGQLFFGENLLAWIVLALGGALACGNLLALVRPPRQSREGELNRAPVGRSLVMGTLGLVAAVWALATLSR